MPKTGKGAKRAPVGKDRFISKMFLHGGSVIQFLQSDEPVPSPVASAPRAAPPLSTPPRRLHHRVSAHVRLERARRPLPAAADARPCLPPRRQRGLAPSSNLSSCMSRPRVEHRGDVAPAHTTRDRPRAADAPTLRPFRRPRRRRLALPVRASNTGTPSRAPCPDSLVSIRHGITPARAIWCADAHWPTNVRTAQGYPSPRRRRQ